MDLKADHSWGLSHEDLTKPKLVCWCMIKYFVRCILFLTSWFNILRAIWFFPDLGNLYREAHQHAHGQSHRFYVVSGRHNKRNCHNIVWNKNIHSDWSQDANFYWKKTRSAEWGVQWQILLFKLISIALYKIHCIVGLEVFINFDVIFLKWYDHIQKQNKL